MLLANIPATTDSTMMDDHSPVDAQNPGEEFWASTEKPVKTERLRTLRRHPALRQSLTTINYPISTSGSTMHRLSTLFKVRKTQGGSFAHLGKYPTILHIHYCAQLARRVVRGSP